ncbi:MAG: 16S rRNA (cytosine(1402)-N(4))-methyltransferase RsmH [Chloroflexi bacterium]|nr:16S rRNA (cytosine(1402)-N(4))-methyltransferase RsmH [Chloroflexota bacterium]
MEIHHTPVMVGEVLSTLQIDPSGSYIDCTLGEGGHASAILGATDPPPRLLGIDLDMEALESATRRLSEFSGSFVAEQGNFAEVGDIAVRHEFESADGILFDLGLSSLQVDTAARGFSFRKEARLDMRFDTSQMLTAAEVVNGFSESELANVIYRYGEERRSRRIASAIVRSRPLDTTTQLAEVISRVLGGSSGRRIHPATKTFQAIRMAVNGELDNVEKGLDQAIGVLREGGRIVVISYHSLEDRLVKGVFRREASSCICPPEIPMCVCGHEPVLRLVSRRVIRPGPEEIRTNPRSRSARLRVAERI